MLLRTKYACPVCVKSDYTKVQSSCVVCCNWFVCERVCFEVRLKGKGKEKRLTNPFFFSISKICFVVETLGCCNSTKQEGKNKQTIRNEKYVC